MEQSLTISCNLFMANTSMNVVTFMSVKTFVENLVQKVFLPLMLKAKKFLMLMTQLIG